MYSLCLFVYLVIYAVHLVVFIAYIVIISFSVRPTSTFYEELSSVLELLVVHLCPVVMGGDFNIHVDDANDPETRRLNELLAAYSVHQYVDKPTHRCGRTLDLVMTFMHHLSLIHI